ncbi:MAG: hypothetical protein C4332_02900 [Meiothermus sp.]
MQRDEQVVDTMHEGMVLQDAQGQIVACNSRAEEILGLIMDQMLGRSSTDARWQTLHEDGSPFPGSEHPAMYVLRTGEPQLGVVMGVQNPAANRPGFRSTPAPSFPARLTPPRWSSPLPTSPRSRRRSRSWPTAPTTTCSPAYPTAGCSSRPCAAP